MIENLFRLLPSLFTRSSASTRTSASDITLPMRAVCGFIERNSTRLPTLPYVLYVHKIATEAINATLREHEINSTTGRKVWGIPGELRPDGLLRTVSGGGVSPAYIRDEMSRLELQMVQISDELGDIERAAFYLCRFLAIGPLGDGNFRVGWLLLSSMLIASGITKAVPRAPSSDKMREALAAAVGSNDLRPTVNLISTSIGQNLRCCDSPLSSPIPIRAVRVSEEETTPIEGHSISCAA